MPKITRADQKILGSTSTTLTQIGSSKSGVPNPTSDPNVIQALPEFLAGWKAACLVAGEYKAPVVDEFDAMDFVLSRNLAYIFQEGIVEWYTNTTYYINSIVKKVGTYELYGSKVIDNQGNALPAQVDDANWQYLGDLGELKDVGGFDVSLGSTGYIRFPGTSPNRVTIQWGAEPSFHDINPGSPDYSIVLNYPIVFQTLYQAVPGLRTSNPTNDDHLSTSWEGVNNGQIRIVIGENINLSNSIKGTYFAVGTT